jgi:hypothetical protein
MNPYLEQEEVWQDFHQRFITATAEMLSRQVTPSYIVKIEEHLYIHELSAEQRLLLGRADVGLAQTARPAGQAATADVRQAPAPVRLPAVDVERHAYIEIRDRQGRPLVTVLELLSPSNKKPGPDREQYLGKRANLLRSETHFVEIDLLRGGPRMPLEGAPPCDYCVLVSRVEKRLDADFWPRHLRDPLPVIPIPLRDPHPDARLDLQQVLHRVYDTAYYQDYIYDGAPVPALTPDDAAWARQLLPGSSA